MGAERASSEITEDAVLGGRLRLRQPKRGHRVGHDGILLAAATGGRAGEHAVDLGAGVGGAGLALAVRVAGLGVTLVEIDATLCKLATDNVGLNAMDGRVRVAVADVEDDGALAAAGLKAGSIDRVLMNPPFNDGRRQNISPDPRRRLAHVGDAALLPRWIKSAAWLLRPNGTLTLIWRADALPDVLAALKNEFGGFAVLPVFPRQNTAAIRVLVRAVKGGTGTLRDYPSLILNDKDNRPTAAAEAVLRGGGMLDMAEH